MKKKNILTSNISRRNSLVRDMWHLTATFDLTRRRHLTWPVAWHGNLTCFVQTKTPLIIQMKLFSSEQDPPCLNENALIWEFDSNLGITSTTSIQNYTYDPNLKISFNDHTRCELFFWPKLFFTFKSLFQAIFRRLF